MASQQLTDQLVKHIDEALAMEQNVLRMLDGMIASTEDEEIKNELRHHKLETEQHAERLEKRLAAHDASPSTVREATGIMGGLMKGVVDMVRQEKAGRNARDGYATEHLVDVLHELVGELLRCHQRPPCRVARSSANRPNSRPRNVARPRYPPPCRSSRSTKS